MSIDTLSILRSHRSIRRFRPDPVPDDHIRAAVEAGQRASTSSAVQAYCLIRVTDAATRSAIADLAGPQPKIVHCGAFFVICGDTRRHRLACARDGERYDARLEAFLLSVIDASLFAEKMVIAFESMGYGVCYIGGLRNDLAKVDELLELPQGVLPLYGLCVGLPDEDPIPRPRLPVEAVLFDDRYPYDERMLALMAEYDEAYELYRRARGDAPAKWSDIMARKFASPERTHLGPFYTSKGVDLS